MRGQILNIFESLGDEQMMDDYQLIQERIEQIVSFPILSTTVASGQYELHFQTKDWFREFDKKEVIAAALNVQFHEFLKCKIFKNDFGLYESMCISSNGETR